MKNKYKVIKETDPAAVMRASELRKLLRSYFDAGFKMAVTAFNLKIMSSGKTTEEPYQFKQHHD